MLVNIATHIDIIHARSFRIYKAKQLCSGIIQEQRESRNKVNIYAVQEQQVYLQHLYRQQQDQVALKWL